MTDNNRYMAYIFDLDGTLYLGEDMIPGAADTLQWVRKNGAKVRFVTNNPRYSREFYVNKLNMLGISAEVKEVVTSAQLTANYLKKHPKYGSVFVIGEEQLKRELTSANLSLVESTQADTVLVSFDTTLTYDKLLVAYRSLNKGAHFIATNPDPVCPTSDGGLIDAGAIIAALETATGRKAEKVIGKPSRLLADLLINQLNVPAKRCVVVGDRLNTDVHLGKQAEMTAVWIRSNNEKISDEIVYHPDYILNSIAGLPSALSKNTTTRKN